MPGINRIVIIVILSSYLSEVTTKAVNGGIVLSDDLLEDLLRGSSSEFVPNISKRRNFATPTKDSQVRKHKAATTLSKNEDRIIDSDGDENNSGRHKKVVVGSRNKDWRLQKDIMASTTIKNYADSIIFRDDDHGNSGRHKKVVVESRNKYWRLQKDVEASTTIKNYADSIIFRDDDQDNSARYKNVVVKSRNMDSAQQKYVMAPTTIKNYADSIIFRDDDQEISGRHKKVVVNSRNKDSPQRNNTAEATTSNSKGHNDLVIGNRSLFTNIGVDCPENHVRANNICVEDYDYS